MKTDRTSSGAVNSDVKLLVKKVVQSHS